MEVTNLRQSDKWAQYLKHLDWNIEETSAGIKVAIRKTTFGNVSKIQRPKNISEQDMDEIEKICKDKKCVFIKIEPGTKQDEGILKARGYQVSKFPLSPPSTIYIDLSQSEQKLWKNLTRSCKYSVRRARREGSAVETIQNPNEKELKEFYMIAKDTAKKKKFYIEPFEHLLKQKEVFGDSSYLAKVYDDEKVLHGAKYYLGNKNVVTFTMGGTSEEGRQGKGGYVLLWQSILYFKELGYEFLDLEGVDDDRFPLFTREWGGFSHFKEKFGGTIVRLPPPYIKYESSVLKFLSKIQELPL